MLEDILRQLKNWFVVEIHDGDFTIDRGELALPFLREGQYFRIFGSTFNDGLHQYPAVLADETFNGTIWALAVPSAVLALADEVAAWQEKHGAAAMSPLQSESFGGYSYTRATGSSGSTLTWQDVFRKRLNAWRKI